LALLLLWPALAAVSDIDPNKTAGNPSAPVTVQIFSDFECPACQGVPRQQPAAVAAGLRGHRQGLPGVSRVPSAHPRALARGANYAVAAARLSLYQPVADALFRDQSAWSVNGKVWDTVASVLTLSQQKKVKAAADGPSALGEILRDVNLGHAVPVTSTPTLVVSRGSKTYPVSGTLNYAILKSLIDDLLK